jgi:hypothetical protein
LLLKWQFPQYEEFHVSLWLNLALFVILGGVPQLGLPAWNLWHHVQLEYLLPPSQKNNPLSMAYCVMLPG